MDESKQNIYDQVIAVVMNNAISERMLNGRIVLRDFQSDNPSHQLYFMASSIIADMHNENIYISMPIIKYWKFKWQNRRRKNIRFLWKSTIEEIELDNYDANYKITTVDTIVNFVAQWARDTFQISRKEFDNIYREVYVNENSSN